MLFRSLHHGQRTISLGRPNPCRIMLGYCLSSRPLAPWGARSLRGHSCEYKYVVQSALLAGKPSVILFIISDLQCWAGYPYAVALVSSSAGKLKEKVEPSPLQLSTQIRPRYRLMISLEIYRPIPRPG